MKFTLQPISFFILLSVLFCSPVAFAQNNPTDVSFEKEDNIDLSKVPFYNQLFDAKDLQERYRATSGAEHIQYTFLLSLYLQNTDKYADAIPIITDAAQTAGNLGNAKAQGLMTARLGYLYGKLNNHDKEIENYSAARKIFDDLKLKKNIAEIDFLMAKSFYVGNQTQLAVEHLKTGIEAAKASKMHALENSMTYLLNEIDGQKAKYQEALNNLLAVEKTNATKLTVPQKFKLYKAIGYSYFGVSEYEKAIEYFNKSLPMQNPSLLQDWESMDEYTYVNDKGGKGGNGGSKFFPYTSSDSTLRKLLTIKLSGGKNIEIPLIDAYSGKSYSNLSKDEIERMNKNTEAMIQRLILEKDSVSKSELNYNTDEIRAREEQINKLIKEKQLQALAFSNKELEIERAKYFKYWMVAIVVLMIAIVIFILLRFNAKRKSLKKVNTAYTELNKTHDQLKNHAGTIGSIRKIGFTRAINGGYCT